MKVMILGLAMLASIPYQASAQNSAGSEEYAKAKAAQDAAMADIERQEMAHKVPPIRCNGDFARLFMVEHVANRLFVPPERIAAIGTLSGAGGDGISEGKPGDRNYSSQMSCPIRVTFVGGGHKYVTYNERYSTLYGEEFALSPFPTNPDNPSLQWIDTLAPH